MKISTKGQTVREAQSNRFAPLEAGEYTVSIFDVTPDEYKSEANKGKPYYRLQLRVADGQKGANRRLFTSIPLFLEWGPTKKNPNGSDAFTFYDFFAAIKGVKSSEFRAEVKKVVEAEEDLSVPTPKELMGKKVNVVLKIVADTYAFERAEKEGSLEDGETQQDFLTNDISGWKPYAEIQQEASETVKAFEL